MLARRTVMVGLLGGWVAALVLALPLTTSEGAVLPRATGQLPRLPAFVDVGIRYLEIRPANLDYTGDGSGVLSGPKPGSKLHWNSWSTQAAFGGGYNLVDDCKPNCARGHFGAFPIKIEAWKPGLSHGELVFSRVTILYTAKAPAGQPTHYTFTTNYANGWGLGPPGIDGYCSHTDGQPQAAGCANVTALPPGLASSAERLSRSALSPQRSATGQASR